MFTSREPSVNQGIGQEICHCVILNKPWLRKAQLAKMPHPINLIAYIRTNGSELDTNQQLKLIQDFCSENGYQISKVFRDEGKISFGLQAALKAIDEASGLIAVDLNRFVQHSADRFRDLRPLIHHFFCHTNKHLITVKEGVHTGSIAGQIPAIEVITDPKEYD